METICLMRDIYRAIQTFEADFQKVHRVCMNEAMLLCSLSGGKRSAAEIAAINAMSPSHTSKVIRSVERRGSSSAYSESRTKLQNVFRTDGGRKEMPCGDEVRQRGRCPRSCYRCSGPGATTGNKAGLNRITSGIPVSAETGRMARMRETDTESGDCRSWTMRKACNG